MLRGAIAVAAVAVVAGCASTVAGRPATSVPSASPVNAAALDTGAYPITPRPPLGTAGSEDAGRVVEGRRMAGYVVGPWQVDPTLSRPGPTGSQVITDRLGLGAVIYPELLTQGSLIPIVVGFSCERDAADSANPAFLRNAVLRVADPDAAAALARGIAAGGLNMPPAVLKTATMIPTEPIRPVPIPAHLEATGMLLAHREGDQIVQEVIAVSAHGPYLLIQVARSAQGPDRAAALAGSTLDQQIPRLDAFTPTDPVGFSSLPLDPTGLLARTVPLKGQGNTMSDASFDRAGGLQLEDDPVAAGRAFDDAAVDVVTASQTTVYQAADPSRAQKLSAALGAAAAARRGAQDAAAVPGLPESRCVDLNDTGGIVTRYLCTASADRYAFKTIVRQLPNAQQQIAAQYRMLVG